VASPSYIADWNYFRIALQKSFSHFQQADLVCPQKIGVLARNGSRLWHSTCKRTLQQASDSLGTAEVHSSLAKAAFFEGHMIQCFFQVVVSPENRESALELVRFLSGPILGTPGCLRCKACQDLSDGNSIVLLQEWESDRERRQFMRSQDYRPVLALLDLSSKPPEIRFNTISGTGGIEIIQSALSGQPSDSSS
jgi:quinol monooxygenase YgiN